MCALGRSVREPVLCPANTRGREGQHLLQRHPPRPPPGGSDGEAGINHLRRCQCTLIRRNGVPDITPRPQAPSPTPGDPKTRHALSTPGIPVPPADGLPSPGAGYCVAHDALKIRHHGDKPLRGTVHRLVEGGDSGAPVGHLRPHKFGPIIFHPGTETGYQDKPCLPTTHYLRSYATSIQSNDDFYLS